MAQAVEYDEVPDEIEEESIISDKCWVEMHRGDGRKWLMRDGQHHNRNLLSTMKTSFTYNRPGKEKSNVGKRKAMLLEALYNEAADEIVQEQLVPPPVEEYCTEYDGNFNVHADMIQTEDEEAKKVLQEKYPLYTSPAMSYWNFQIEKRDGGKISLPGLTASIDLKNPFKRNSGFTKPISEVLDDCHL